jgi:hypothetical protein
MIKTKATNRMQGEQMLRLQSFLSRSGLSRGARRAGRAGQRRWEKVHEEGATLVEMALVSAIMLSLLFGVIQVCLALYAYNFVCEAAREATRYAMVRGESSCLIAPSFPNCNLNPTTAGNTVQDFARSLGYPGLNANNLTATATWWSPTGTQPESWTTACTAATCNAKGHMVEVQVNYAFPLNIPFWKNSTLNLGSTSEMMISE